jgi:hypothetical protein
VQAAHLRAASPRHGKLASGIGSKPDDAWTTPLCVQHHVLDEAAQHNNREVQFWEQHGIDPFVLALALWRASGDDEAAFLILNEIRRAGASEMLESQRDQADEPDDAARILSAT